MMPDRHAEAAVPRVISGSGITASVSVISGQIDAPRPEHAPFAGLLKYHGGDCGALTRYVPRS